MITAAKLASSSKGHNHPTPVSNEHMNLQNTCCVWCLELSHFSDGRTEMVSLAPGLGSGRAKQGPLDGPPASAPSSISCGGKDGYFLEVRNKPSAPSAGESTAPLKVA